MSEAMEMCEWFESIIEDLIEEYRFEDDITLEYMHGATEALEKLLEILKKA